MKKMVLVVDDHETVRIGLGFIIDKQPRFKVIAYAKNKAEALNAAENYNLDIAIVDIRLKGEDGIEICKEITSEFPHIKVLMLTSFSDDELILKAIKAGACGYLLKDVSNNEILRALHEVADGGFLFDASVTARVMDMMKNIGEEKKMESFNRKLSESENKVLSLICQGKTNSEIGDEMDISGNTVKTFVSNIFIKLEVNNRAEAAAFATKNNILRM